MAVRLLVFLTLTLTLVNAGTFKDYYESVSSEKEQHRRPAAIAPVELNIEKPDYKESLIEINCGRKLAQEMRVNSPWAQIKGRYCKPTKGKVVEIVNKSNGFTASLFEVGDEKYKTDLIQLSQGVNEIQIRATGPSGLIEEQTLLIHSSAI